MEGVRGSGTEVKGGRKETYEGGGVGGRRSGREEEWEGE